MIEIGEVTFGTKLRESFFEIVGFPGCLLSSDRFLPLSFLIIGVNFL